MCLKIFQKSIFRRAAAATVGLGATYPRNVGGKTLRKVFVALTLLPLAACAAGPDDRAEDFIEAAAKGDTAEAIEHIDPQIQQLFGPKLVAGVQRQTDTVRQRGGLTSVDAFNPAVEGDSATVDIKVRYKNAPEENAKMKMRKVEGKWYVTP